MEIDTIKSAADVTLDVGRDVRNCLISHDLAKLTVDTGYGPKRLVIVTLDGDAQEFMVALEGDGCKFISREDGINKFAFIQGGFDMIGAEIVVAILAAVATTIQEFNTRPQIAAEARSD